MALELYQEGYKVSDICRGLNISRSRFYRHLPSEGKNFECSFKINDSIRCVIPWSVVWLNLKAVLIL
ncbi:MAG: Helix-turn-helix domain of resolvase [Deferribacteraceae bacterium]|jgi:DNA invertase Pin-like site-specific DNA recombinase|nr:Helix-turn-helix domain of resolvase [Deferribacteraceae bacterium]